MTNRALVLAALADGPSTLRDALDARDTRLMTNALRALGATITDDDTGCTTITPGPVTGETHVECGLAGTVMRFVPPIAALADGKVSFDGDVHARKRPIDTVITALRQLGAIVGDDGRGALPFVVYGQGSVPGGEVTIDASESSQFVSCLLLSGARYDDGVTVHHDGKPVPSLPHIDMTVAMLRENGVEVDDSEANTWRVEPGPIKAVDRAIEPDLSNAAPFLGAALVSGGSVRITAWPEETSQAGDALRDLLERFGATCQLDDDGLLASGPTEPLTGVDFDLHDVSELTPVIAAIATFATAPSFLRGVAHIRGHETNRLEALATEINRLGGDATETEDGLHIRPSTLHGGVFESYADHRMAQAGALIGLGVEGVQVEDVETTSKTMPDFPQRWARMIDESSNTDEATV